MLNVSSTTKTSASMSLKSKIKSTIKSKSQSTASTARPGILMRGWFKYMKIQAGADSQDFRTNPEYFKELKYITSDEAQKRDEVGPLTIPDDKSFYMILTTSTLNVLTSRRNQITKTYDVLDLNIVKDINESVTQDGATFYKGGIISLGQFDEGICFKLNLKSGNS